MAKPPVRRSAKHFRNRQWVDGTSCSALCALILDDRKGGGSVGSQCASDAGHLRRRALPPAFYAQQVAPFLRFDDPQPNMVYAIGGRSQRHGSLKSVEMFDTWHGQWVPCPPMPTRRAGSAAALLPDKRVLVVGGYDERGTFDGLLASCDAFDPVRQCWQEGIAPLTRQRWGHACATLGGRVYAVGGCSPRRGSQPREECMETLRSCEVYIPEENRWDECAPLQVSRSGLRVVVVEGRYLVAVGGYDDVFGRAEMLSTVELYDPQLNTWQVLNLKLQQPRTTAGVTSIGGNKVVVAGGAPSLASVEVYAVGGCSPRRGSQPREDAPDDPFGGNATIGDMAEGRLGCQAVMVALPGVGTSYPLSLRPSVMIVGGENCGRDWEKSHQFASVLVFDIASGTWRDHEPHLVPPLPSPRTALALCVGVGRVAMPM